MIWMKLYKHFFKMHVKEMIEYKLNSIIGIIAIAMTNVTTLVFFWAIFSKIPNLNGWTLGQLLFIVGVGSLSFGFKHAFFSGVTPHRISWLIRNGDLDRFILRPIGELPHMLMTAALDVDGLGDLISGMAMVVVASSMLGLQWSVFNLFLFTIMIISTTLILISFDLIITTLAFWVINVNALIDMYYASMRFSEYPIDIFNGATRFVLTFVIPFGFVSYYPAQIFIGKGIWMNAAYLTPAVAVIIFGVAFKFWKFGLKKYGSAGN